MFEKIMLMVDGSEQSEKIFEFVRAITVEFSPEIHLALACPLQREYPFERILMNYLDNSVSKLKGNSTVKKTLLKGNIGETNHKYINNNGIDLFCMATYERPDDRGWAKIISETALRSNVQAVLTVPEASIISEIDTSINRILVPLDGSKIGAMALPWAEKLALETGAKIILLQVVPFSEHVYGGLGQAAKLQNQLLAALQESTENYLKDIKSTLLKKGIQCDYAVSKGKPEQEIMKYAENNSVDLIAMSTHGHSGIGHFILGSIADKISEKIQIPLLIVKP